MWLFKQHSLVTFVTVTIILSEEEVTFLPQLRMFQTLRLDRLLLPSNIPPGWRHQQFTDYRTLTCRRATPKITKETGDQNTTRVESRKCSSRLLLT